ncbi:G-type lectin S-receptor-like serine/threonine-protein kinase At4g03230 [Macadamia integrifolia]|uniref:G-type lectin S-receptor-like serine/threonine-protein kinase At4g03230 n=1 Tax=Macadamia integrifolia TaxID=60698 RepID=UPI001C5302BC|nr:G-type lectin S-receptor-like serine/threonine-protein kinase At4g03230 [Macadamia integrifolia]
METEIRKRGTRRITRSMIHYSHMIIYGTLLLLSCSSLMLCSAGGIGKMKTVKRVIHDGETIVSKGKIFEFGFFTPDGAKHENRYVGIWYYGLPKTSTTVVWVANREKPIPNTKGSIIIREDVNLEVLDELGKIHWSTEFSIFRNPLNPSYTSRNPAIGNTSEILTDSGNLILNTYDGDDMPVWESFREYSNTFLPGMGNISKAIQSWRNEYDPSPGSFTFQFDKSRYIIKNGSNTYWKSQSSIIDFANPHEIPSGVEAVLSDRIGHPDYNNTRIVMHPSGQIRVYNLSDLIWYVPSDNCSIYNACGPYGICNNSSTNLQCKCLKGFKPKSPADWDSGEFSAGCININKFSLDCKYDDNKFLSLILIKVENPDSTIAGVKGMDGCKRECLDHCCHAFSLQNSNHCLLWISDELQDLQETLSKVGHEIYVRVASSNFTMGTVAGSNFTMGPHKLNNNNLSTALIVVITIAAVVIVFSSIYCWRIIMRWRKMTKRKAYMESNQETSAFPYDGDAQHANDKSMDVPFFDFESIVAATQDFSNLNKLGQGGFGPVYKGKLMGGQEIAVKRLSKNSGQGLDEFKNEVLLIAKLQHRNLVKLLGYSIKGDEKILLYEYMPNRSLDSFIFDQSRCSLLNWEKRFNIIMGIARGLLYLHQDSRLRIIHRDLKTSNILLDEEMNPKISDFGLARIFGGNQNEENTNRVVGTYGYMSPEYALNGIFSVKSDVFSFGVMLLEIISGKKNMGFPSEHSLNLLGYAWELWKKDKVLAFMDKSVSESYIACEVSKCVNVGLLCVQEEANDRPTMSNVIFMLGSETTTLPTPKEPAFIAKKYCPSTTASSSSRPEIYSINELTITEEQGR